MSIRNRYEEELSNVKTQLLSMCRLIEISIEKSIKALVYRDLETSKKLIEQDKDVDNLERDIEQACLKILLMEHPVASDFREISAILKMITDLERIGDHASDISEISLQIGLDKPIKDLNHIQQMAQCSVEMVKDGILSYINHDLDKAKSLDERDDKVDLLFETIKNELIELIQNNKDNANQAILLLLIAKYLERVADHAVNIGEWVEYAIKGYHSHS